jgi:hypothetical protein
MEITVKSGKLAAQTSEALVTGYFEDEKKLPADLASLRQEAGRCHHPNLSNKSD